MSNWKNRNYWKLFPHDYGLHKPRPRSEIRRIFYHAQNHWPLPAWVYASEPLRFLSSCTLPEDSRTNASGNPSVLHHPHGTLFSEVHSTKMIRKKRLLRFASGFSSRISRDRGLLHVQRNHPCFSHSICLCLKAGQTKNHHHYYQGNTGKLFCRVYFLHLVICWYLFLRQIFRKYPYQVRQKKLNLGIFPFFAYLCRRVRDINHYCTVLLIILSRSLL